MEREDPRVFFAAERTLLAWVRTGITIIGLGFLVARFGLFLAVIRSGEVPTRDISVSAVIGIGFVLIGSFVIGAAARQHASFTKTLAIDQRPSDYSISFSAMIAAGLCAMGAGLGLYLVLQTFM